MSKTSNKVVEFRTYDLPLHFSVLLLDGKDWHISDVLSERHHFHNCLEIGICHSDSGILQFGNAELRFGAGDITYIPRYIPHTTCSSRGTRSLWSYLFVDLDRLLFDALPADQAPLPQSFYLFKQENAPRIHFLIRDIIQELRDQKKNHQEAIRSLFRIFYIEILRVAESDSQVPQKSNKDRFSLRPALDYMHQNFAQPLKIQDLADKCNLSETHFRRLFGQIMGASPVIFLNMIRIKQACAQLLTTRKSILSIAEEAGFSSISSFNRCFSQLVRMTPRDYRKQPGFESVQPKSIFISQVAGWERAEEMPIHVSRGS